MRFIPEWRRCHARPRYNGHNWSRHECFLRRGHREPHFNMAGHKWPVAPEKETRA